MSSALTNTTANVPSTRQTSDALFSTSELLVAANVLTQVTTAKHLTTFYMSGLSADIKPRLPSVGSADDGLILRFFHDNNGYEMTPYPYDDTTSVWNSGKGYGITLCEKGCYIELRYVHALTKWIVTYKAGGLVKAEGVVLHEPMTSIGARATGSSTNLRNSDLSGRHAFYSTGDLTCVEENSSKFSPGCYYFDGIGDYILYRDSTDWDIFGDQTGHKTVAGWVYFAASSALRSFMGRYTDATNYFVWRRPADNTIQFIHKYDDATGESLGGGSVLGSVWKYVAIIINGAEIGLYVDNGSGTMVQVDYVSTFDVELTRLEGALKIGQDGTESNLHAGYMQDWFIAYNNPFNATPNSTPDDYFTVPAAPMQLVM